MHVYTSAHRKILITFLRAAAEFGEVESAYRVLTDAGTKEALDNFLRYPRRITDIVTFMT
jgi:hypothetical protein